MCNFDSYFLRDLKPENILLVDPHDDTDVSLRKLVILFLDNLSHSLSSTGLYDMAADQSDRFRTGKEGFSGRPQDILRHSTVLRSRGAYTETMLFQKRSDLVFQVLKRKNSVTGAGRYDTKADMWSIGVILFILLSGSFPFDEDNLLDQVSVYV